MQVNNTTDVLNLEYVTTKRIEECDDRVDVYADLEPLESCPKCGHSRLWVHDYRVQKIKDTQLYGKHCIIHLTKTRQNCPSCGKRVERVPNFIAPKKTMTMRLIAFAVKELHSMQTMTSVAESCNTSVNTIMRILSNISPSRKKLPSVLCIDEFKGDSGGNKYLCSLMDGISHSMLDILPNRSLRYLTDYFLKMGREELSNVEVFVSDMFGGYKSLKRDIFSGAVHVIDPYHYIRLVVWALENVRKRIQKELPAYKRKYMKRSKSLLNKPASKLSKEEMVRVADMLDASEELRLAYNLKEGFYDYVLMKIDSKSAGKALKLWIEMAKESGLDEFKECITAFTNWFVEITNSFDYEWSNGPLEGTHNKIKVLKRNSYGFPNFKRFRSRILMVCK